MSYMVAGQGLFDNFEDKQEREKKMEKDTVEIKIRFNKFWLERIIYIVIILILLVFVFYNPFSKFRCEKGLSGITSTPVVSEPAAEETTEPKIEEEPVVEAEPEAKLEPEAEKELSGKATLSIGDIGLSNDSKRIEYIWVYIDNDKGLFTPLIKVYWYGPSTPDAVKDSVKYEYQFPSLVSTGKSNKKIDSEVGLKNKKALDGRYLNLEEGDKKATFKIELYNANDKELLDTKTKTIALS